MSLERAFELTRLEFAIAFTACICGVAYAMNRPEFMVAEPELHPWSDLMVPGGVAGILLGTYLMYWIWRRGPEAGPSPWRYRRETD